PADAAAARSDRAGLVHVRPHEGAAIDHEGGAVALRGPRRREQVVAGLRIVRVGLAFQLSTPGLAQLVGSGAKRYRAEAVEAGGQRHQRRRSEERRVGKEGGRWWAPA